MGAETVIMMEKPHIDYIRRIRAMIAQWSLKPSTSFTSSARYCGVVKSPSTIYGGRTLHYAAIPRRRREARGRLKRPLRDHGADTANVIDMRLFHHYHGLRAHHVVQREFWLFELSIWIHMVARSLIAVFLPILMLRLGYSVGAVIIYNLL